MTYRFLAPFLAPLFGAAILTAPAMADQVGKVGVDWVGNDIVIESIKDPKVEGVTCHIAYFSRSMFDRLKKGNWFEDPSNSAIQCARTGAVRLGDIARGPKGEDVFRESRSLFFKTLRVKRIYDEGSNTLIYLSHASDVGEGSAKMSMSTVYVGN